MHCSVRLEGSGSLHLKKTSRVHITQHTWACAICAPLLPSASALPNTRCTRDMHPRRGQQTLRASGRAPGRGSRETKVPCCRVPEGSHASTPIKKNYIHTCMVTSRHPHLKGPKACQVENLYTKKTRTEHLSIQVPKPRCLYL